MKTKTTTTTRAAELVGRVEELALGAPSAPALAAARAALEEARAAATEKLFPSAITPTSADVIAARDHYQRRAPAGAGYGQALAAVHARALATWPVLAAALRTPEVIDDVGDAATVNIVVPGDAQARAAATARRAFELAVARQILAVPGHGLVDAARELLAVEDLEQRLVAARERHEQHARDEAARLEAEREAAARQEAEREAAARQEAEQRRLAAEGAYRDQLEAERLARCRELAGAIDRSKVDVLVGPGDKRFNAAEIARWARNGGLSIADVDRFERYLADTIERGAA